MGIEPYLLSSSVVGVLAQRLVRTICKECIEAYEPTSIELKELGIASQVPFYCGRGCSHCYGSGYKGRHGIYELMLVDGSIKRQLLKSADAAALKATAQSSGMMSLRHEGGFLVAQGITTSREILRVSRCAEEI